MQSAIAEAANIGIELQRRFRASPERVFRAWTQAGGTARMVVPTGLGRR
jgi:uncharacterized protein YndB with AHSA1/START domain